MVIPYSTAHLPGQLFLNNEYVDAKNTRTLATYNPRDGALLSDQIPVAGEEDVDLAVAYAEDAFRTWKHVQANRRRQMLFKLADLMEEHAESLASISRLEIGASMTSTSDEIAGAIEGIRYYAGWIDKLAGESFPQDDGFLKIVRHEPLGVTAAIIPWNGPLITIGLKAAPALASGNCFILKPSEKASLSPLAFGSLVKAAGFPPGVFQILSGDGETGSLLASHMRIRKITFTGSGPTGRKIQEMAAKSNLKRVTLELGGKSPAVVFDDCNLENAVRWTVQGITMNSGQVCFAASRVYVQEGIYDRFLEAYLEALKAKSEAMKNQTNGSLGPLIDQAQFNRVMGFIARGQNGQGTLALGGARIGDKGFFLEPTVFTDVDVGSEIHTHEIFGPISVLRRFKTEEEIMALSNGTSFGLMAGVFSQDINKALRVASDFESGMVGVNCISLNFFNVPFGGVKESGIGRECGAYALKAFTEPKTIMVNMTY
ncbi:aldehyde dehydrogenase [Colletotrichum costaricense]|uniref:aldehyde dehydrogenase (NAD(+)) n=1 Tax=Colletotrichum costaricense TaxID=1209916 RepID=A0AAJ0DT78_9PEZI|nr:aldehyde dehydrogenase [Colletotrichum costaricense]KAK1509328.1 aldehyde dehydrogenase [Colletotrichum costaricense]